MRRHRAFDVLIFTSHVAVVTKIIAKRECPSFFTPASFDDVHVMTVRPLNRPMKEWTEGVIRMRNVNVSDGLKTGAVREKRLKRRD